MIVYRWKGIQWGTVMGISLGLDEDMYMYICILYNLYIHHGIWDDCDVINQIPITWLGLDGTHIISIYIYMMWWTILQGEGVKSDMPVYSQTSPWAQLKRVKSDIPQKVNQNISKHHGHTFRRDLFGIGWFHRILCAHCRKSQYRTMMLKDYNRRI